jgi:hypothetical protein
MSNRYKGAVISATPPTTTGGEEGTASGAWTLEQQMQLTAAGLWPLQPTPKYIEDVFSTYLYTGNGTSQTITNGINLSANGGLVWSKDRGQANNNVLQDTVRGVASVLSSNLSAGDLGYTNNITAFGSTGYSISNGSEVNRSTGPYASWTFREQAKFFDIVTYTGNGAASQTINHNLGSVPGCMIVKGISGATNWPVYHRSMDATPQNYYVILDGTAAKSNAVANWGNTAPTSTQFTVGGNNNANGYTYVTYLFAHDAGGFGLTGTDNVISCGSISGFNARAELGYEPQWVLMKEVNFSSNWLIYDNMRGWVVTQNGDSVLFPNLSNAEYTGGDGPNFDATGFNFGQGGETYIYIAIRRGPMKVPTVGTSVFLPSTYVGSNSVNQVINTGFTVDMTWARARNASVSMEDYDRLRGNTVRLSTDSTAAEISATALYFDLSNKVSLRAGYNLNYSTLDFIAYNFQRAPGFFDEVCYTGDGTTNRSITHNLQAVPELIIRKSRSAVGSWSTLTKFETSNYIELNLNSASEGSVRSYAANQYLSAKPTSTVFTVNTTYNNNSGVTFVAYLFATCAGVSKVGLYTGTGTTLQIDCGFTGGTRFVLIKRYDADFSGDWYVWDSARGIVAGNDPYLLLNSSAAEVTNTDYVDTYNAGFEISSTAPAAINANGGTFIFLAIA